MGRGTPTGGRPKQPARDERKKIEVHMTAALFERIDREAKRLGLSLAGFVRLRVTEAVSRSEREG